MISSANSTRDARDKEMFREEKSATESTISISL